MHWLLMSERASPLVRSLEKLVRHANPDCEATLLSCSPGLMRGQLTRPVTHILAVVANEKELHRLIHQKQWIDGKPLVLVLRGRKRFHLASQSFALTPRFTACYPEESEDLKRVLFHLTGREFHYQEQLKWHRRAMKSDPITTLQ